MLIFIIRKIKVKVLETDGIQRTGQKLGQLQRFSFLIYIEEILI